MPLDHYVSQVHLRNFYSPNLKSQMYAIRKYDLKSFTTSAQSVCRIEHGSTNKYLREMRVIEEFLKDIEPKYNSAIARFLENNIDQDSVYVIAGFVAYILTCSPAGMRIHSASLRASVEESARMLDITESIPPPPQVLGGKNLTDLLDSGKVHVEVDPRYPQALGIDSIYSHINIFGNSSWDIMINLNKDSPFFTSDFPVVIEKSKDPRVFNRIIPLSPNLAIRICPDLLIDREKNDFSFSKFRNTIRKINHQESRYINSLIVRGAETIVFFCDDYNWIPGFVKKHAEYRIEPWTQRIPCGNRTLLWSTQGIIKTTNNKNLDTSNC